MLIRISPSSLRDGRWHEYVIRFVLGGAAAVVTGAIAQRFGPAIGGVFLALPAIFCASVTLIEAHEIRRKRAAGLAGKRRGREAAALDAVGAALGSLGMLAFAATFYGLGLHNATIAFIAATATWLAVSGTAWWIRRKLHRAATARTGAGRPDQRRPPLVSSPRR